MARRRRTNRNRPTSIEPNITYDETIYVNVDDDVFLPPDVPSGQPKPTGKKLIQYAIGKKKKKINESKDWTIYEIGKDQPPEPPLEITTG